MKAEGATDQTRMKHGSNSVFYPCSIGGWASFRTLPAPRSLALRASNSPLHAPCSQTCATPTTYEEWSETFETTEHNPFAGKGLRRRHRCATQTEKLRRRCALRIFAVRRPALRRNRADLLRAACPLVREPPESGEGEVEGWTMSDPKRLPQKKARNAKKGHLCPVRTLAAMSEVPGGAETTRKREFLGSSWVRSGCVLGSSWVRSGSIPASKMAKNKAKTRCSKCEEKTSARNAGICTKPSSTNTARRCPPSPGGRGGT